MVLLLLLLTALFAVLTGVDRRSLHRDRRSQWLAVLFAPLGATLRWQLSQLNFKLPGGAKWFPLGTFVANMVACAIDFSLAVRHSRTVLNVTRQQSVSCMASLSWPCMNQVHCILHPSL